MKFSILIPHYKSKIIAYSVSKLIEHKGGHDIEILICDNSPGHESINYLKPFMDQVNIIQYSKDVVQSHGAALDILFELAYSESVLTMESDSFPTRDGYLDYYERLINNGYDSAGSFLRLSGGLYQHPAAALYKRSLWVEAWNYYQTLQYVYFPGMGIKENHAMHVMVHNNILEEFLNNPDDYIVLSDGYKPYTINGAIEQARFYNPITKGVMHQGMGRVQESVKTYGDRSPETDAPSIILDNKAKIIYRAGYEPGQAMTYWQLANKKRIYDIPTEIKWIKGTELQQQEYTINECGMKHIWAGSSYLDMKGTSMNDVYEFKHNQIEELYNSLPEHQKIKQ